MSSEGKISFIMPAKDEERYIANAIEAIIKNAQTDWELIVIDDHSTDNTYKIVQGLAEKYDTIRIEKNRGYGKVEGLNFGYELSKGSIIKCIDADDLIDAKLFSYIAEEKEVVCHDYFIVTSKLEKIGISRINTRFLVSDFQTCFKHLISLPRCTWSFNREIGDKIFPIPSMLPFEDVWFSLIIKKYAKSINYIAEPLYYYRQNDNQTYGGMLNFSNEIVSFRAKRMLRVIEVLETDENNNLTADLDIREMLKEIKTYYGILSREKTSTFAILNSRVNKNFILKLLLLKKLNWTVSPLHRLSWKYRDWKIKNKTNISI